tara:strand:+ start:3164 stop:4306 length:1143 start_codon:yes stop_codon:yes gene_type:complete
MIKKNNQMKLSEIRKYLLAKGFKISRLNKNSKTKELKSLYLTFLFSLLLISFFFALPKGYQLSTKIFLSPEEIQNKSKSKFENTIAKKKDDKISKESKVDEGINLKNLFDDIFELEKLPSSSVRLSASTIEQLFKDEKYSLADVRKNKIVKPITIGLLPKEIKKIENTKKRKNLFIKIVLPLILEENNRIKLDRKRLFVILNKNNNSKSEKEWLKKKFKQYGVLNNDLSTLKIRMDEIPVSIAIAQAAKETGWGTSRFALEGNALFGQWTFSGEGIKPAAADIDAKHKVMKFKVLKASVRAYQRNLNTHSSYKKFRKERAIQRDNDEKLNSIELVKYLDKYAETGDEYTKVLKKIIEQNSLSDFDDAKMLPTSKKLKNLI